MNEIELIRAQLNVERQHASAVAQACASARAAGAASVEYLAWSLSRFEEREQVVHDLVRQRFAAEDPTRRAMESALGLPGSSREVLAKLERALNTGPAARSGPASAVAAAWSEFLQLFAGPWSTRRDEIDRLFAAHAKITDWRKVAAIDADSIVDERNRWTRANETRTDTEVSSNTARV
jgi:hypothetical protein